MVVSRRFVPMLATTIALLQITWASVGTLSPWKGGGFGMFASIDQPGNRTIAIRGRDPNGITRVVRLQADAAYGGALSTRLRLRARTVPSRLQAQAIAETVARFPVADADAWQNQAPASLASSRYVEPLARILPTVPPLELLEVPREITKGAPRFLSEVRVSVHRLRFDIATMRVVVEAMNGVTGEARQTP